MHLCLTTTGRGIRNHSKHLHEQFKEQKKCCGYAANLLSPVLHDTLTRFYMPDWETTGSFYFLCTTNSSTTKHPVQPCWQTHHKRSTTVSVRYGCPFVSLPVPSKLQSDSLCIAVKLQFQMLSHFVIATDQKRAIINPASCCSDSLNLCPRLNARGWISQRHIHLLGNFSLPCNSKQRITQSRMIA